LIWARKHGCPWNREICRIIANSEDHQNVLDWIISTGH